MVGKPAGSGLDGMSLSSVKLSKWAQDSSLLSWQSRWQSTSITRQHLEGWLDSTPDLSGKGSTQTTAWTETTSLRI